MQCVSTGMCEHAFGVQNLIKTKVRNKLGSKNLEAMLRMSHFVSLTKSHFERRIVNTIFLYVNPSSYLNSPNTLSVSDVSCSFGAVDTNGNGTQIS